MRTNWEWEQFGEDIRRTVQDAVDSRDFRRLNQTITDSARHPLSCPFASRYHSPLSDPAILRRGFSSRLSIHDRPPLLYI